MQKPNLNKLLSKWRKRLRLQDITITIAWAKANEIDGVGWSKIDRANDIVRIKVLEPQQNNFDEPGFTNVELTIVHELIHVVLHQIINRKPETLEYEIQESTIEKLAKAYLEI